MVINRNLIIAYVQVAQEVRSELTGATTITWINGATIQLSIYKSRTTELVNGVRTVITNYKALTKYRDIQPDITRIFVPSTNESYEVDDSIFDGLWNNLVLKQVGTF